MLSNGKTGWVETPPAMHLFGGRGLAEKPKLLMVTAVWGQWHLNAHLSINLPTLLAPGNLPTLAGLCDIHYLIFTRPDDVERISAAPEINALRPLMSIEIKVLSAADIENPIAGHHKAWEQAQEQAVRARCLLLLMPPDVAWADNSFATVGRLIAAGHRAIFMTYLRVESESFIRTIHERRQDHLVLSVSSRDMVRLSLECLHPLMAAYLHDSEYFPVHPEMILWAVPGEGVAVRVLAREMFLFDPSRYPVNQAALPRNRIPPEEMVFLSDSDAFYGVSLTPLGKDSSWYVVPRTADPVEVGGWWLAYDSPVNDLISAQKVRWHFAPTTDRWQAVERRADRFVRTAAAVREGIRLWRAARRLGCSAAAPFIALAIHTGVFARAVRGRGTALVFLPNDKAIATLDILELENLTKPAGKRRLGRLMRAHFVPDAPDEGDDPLEALGRAGSVVETANGRYPLVRDEEGRYRLDDANVLSGPLKVGNLAVYTVDRLIGERSEAWAYDSSDEVGDGPIIARLRDLIVDSA